MKTSTPYRRLDAIIHRIGCRGLPTIENDGSGIHGWTATCSTIGCDFEVTGQTGNSGAHQAFMAEPATAIPAFVDHHAELFATKLAEITGEIGRIEARIARDPKRAGADTFHRLEVLRGQFHLLTDLRPSLAEAVQ